MYQVVIEKQVEKQIEKQVEKQLEKISEPDFTHIKTAINNLAVDPLPNGYKKLKERPGYRIRQGNYRIIYEINDTFLFVGVITLGHWKYIYN